MKFEIRNLTKPDDYLLQQAALLAHPVLLRLAAELPRRFPKIFGRHQLEQIWAYRSNGDGGGGGGGVPLHCDAGSVTVNLWVSSVDVGDESWRTPRHPGITLFRALAPADWSAHQFNSLEAERDMRTWIEGNGVRDRNVTIPFRANRAVIFRSALFHQTEERKKIVSPDWGGDEGGEYLERPRINVSLLYGKRKVE